MSFLRDSSLVFGYRLVLVAIIFVTDVAIARWFGPAGKGAIAILTVTPAILSVLGQVGQDYALNHAGGRGRTRLLAAFSQSLLITLPLTLLLITGLWLDVFGLRTLLFRGVPIRLQTAQQLAPLLILTEGLFVMGGMLAMSVGRPVMYGQMRVTRRGLVLIGLVTVVLLWGKGSDAAITGYVVVQVVAVLSSALGGALLAGWRFDPPRGLWRELARQGAAAWPGRLAERLQGRVDYVLLGILGSGAAVGVYSVATALAEMLYFVTGSVSATLFSRRAGLVGDLHGRVIRLMVPIAIGIGGLAGLAGTLIVPRLYGQRFAGGVVLLWVLLPGVVGMSLVQILSPYLVQTGRAHMVSVGQAIGVTANIAINVILIPRYAAMGAAIASAISYSATFICIALWTARSDGQTIRQLLLVRADDWRIAIRRARGLLSGSSGS
jgi:O-antigen/teichoic acid export membrane protein